VILILILISCGDDERITGTPEFSAEKERNIRKHNLELKKEQKQENTLCDTLALEDYIIDNYPAGTHLSKFNSSSVYDVPQKAVIYYKDKCSRNQYIFACIIKSKECERFVEPNNVIGYEASFVNLDSTKLGTALFYLTLFECDYNNGSFNRVWEKIVPSQGGFNSIKLKRWEPKNILYVEMNFNDGIISGHRNYNYFLLDGIENKPHLLETYKGISHRRTLANIDYNFFPDYYEYRFRHNSVSISIRDSIPFYWNNKKQLYVTKVNKNWFRKY
jgi:hypothetical protein